MRLFRVAGILVAGVLTAACGGEAEPSLSSEADAPAGVTGSGGNGGGSAIVTLADATYEFDNEGCTVQDNGTVLATFESGADAMSMTSSPTDGVVLIRMTLDGVTWSYSGDGLPEISGSDVAWSGDVSPTDRGDIKETSTIAIAC
jgi:hypothetical protein